MYLMIVDIDKEDKLKLIDKNKGIIHVKVLKKLINLKH
jgi:hypothetical protein